MTNLELFETLIIKPLYYLLYRSAVQSQVLMLLVALLAAWFLSRKLKQFFLRLLPAGPGAEVTEVVYEQEYGPEDEPAKPAKVPVSKEIGPSPAPPSRLNQYLRVVTPYLIAPLLALSTVSAGRLLLTATGQFVGLVDQTLILLTIWFSYRLLVGLLHATMSPESVGRYHYQLLGPLFVLFVIGYGLSWLVDLQVLGNVVMFELFESLLTWEDFFVATVGLYLWLQIVWVIQDILYKLITRRTESDPGTIAASLTLIRYVLIVTGLLYVFSELEFNSTTVAAITTGVTAGIAFGSREILNNFVGGILLLFERSVRPGDTVEIEGTMGVVSAVNFRSTTVQGFDGREIIVPNSTILTSSVVTYTKSSRHARIKIDIGVSYDSDLRQVLELLRGIPKQHENVLADPAPNAFLLSFGESTVNFVLFAWVADLNEKFVTQHELYFMIWDVMNEHEIEMPFPTQDINLRHVPWETSEEEALVSLAAARQSQPKA